MKPNFWIWVRPALIDLLKKFILYMCTFQQIIEMPFITALTGWEEAFNYSVISLKEM